MDPYSFHQSNSHLTLFNTKTVLFDWFVKWKEETLLYDFVVFLDNHIGWTDWCFELHWLNRSFIMHVTLVKHLTLPQWQHGMFLSPWFVASELKAWLLYYSLPSLDGVLPKKFLPHFARLLRLSPFSLVTIFQEKIWQWQNIFWILSIRSLQTFMVFHFVILPLFLVIII